MPRYDERVLEAIRVLDRRDRPIAETCREVGGRAAELGLPRPSYVHVRRLVHLARARENAESERREATRALAADVATRLAVGRYVDVYAASDRLRAARES